MVMMAQGDQPQSKDRKEEGRKADLKLNGKDASQAKDPATIRFLAWFDLIASPSANSAALRGTELYSAFLPFPTCALATSPAPLR